MNSSISEFNSASILEGKPSFDDNMEHLIRVKLKIDSLPFLSYDLPLSMERSIGDCRHTVSLVLAAAFVPS